MHTVELPEEYAIVLQQIDEDGGDDLLTLSETLRFDRGRIAHIVRALQHKGLVAYSADGQRDIWVRVSTKGRRLLQYMWPEASSRLAQSV